MKVPYVVVIAIVAWIIGCCWLIIDNDKKHNKQNYVTDVIYSPKDSSWHLDIKAGKDTVEVPVNAETAAKFINKTH